MRKKNLPKFRAWDKEDEVMIGWFWLSSEGDLYETPVTVYNTPHVEIERNDDLIVMQYTGLKDENGVEIYEGDYIDCKWGYDDWSGVVEFIDGAFCTNPLSDSKFPSIISECSSIKVIGNIYENPELLKGDI